MTLRTVPLPASGTPLPWECPILRLRIVPEGRIDAAIMGPGKAGLIFYLNKDPFLAGHEDECVYLKKPLVRDPNFIDFSKAMKQREAITKALQSMLKDGTIQKISEIHEYTLSR